jgi:hypothetical protein
MKIKADQQFSKISDDKRWAGGAGNMVCGAGAGGWTHGGAGSYASH